MSHQQIRTLARCDPYEFDNHTRGLHQDDLQALLAERDALREACEQIAAKQVELCANYQELWELSWSMRKLAQENLETFKEHK